MARAVLQWREWRGPQVTAAIRNRVIPRALTRYAGDIVAIARSEAPQGVSNSLRNSIGMSKITSQAERHSIVVGVLGGRRGSPHVYAPVMEHGRRPDAPMPPVEALLLWVRRKIQPSGIRDALANRKQRNIAWQRTQRRMGIDRTERMIRSIAFVIARSIARKGIRGRNFFRKAFERTRGHYMKYLRMEYALATKGLR